MQNPFRYFNSSSEIIRLAVMRYVRFPLLLRQMDDLLCEPGIDICHETVRLWWNRFGVLFAAEIRKRRVHHHSYSNWRWRLDEVFVRINGETNYLWRGVDHEGEVLEVFATKRRDRRAALWFVKRALKRYGRPASIVTDRLRSYGTAINVIGNAVAQTCGRWLNNRAENSHQPFKRREGAMAKFRDAKTLQKFASVHGSIQDHFNHKRHLNRRDIFKQDRAADPPYQRPPEASAPLCRLTDGCAARKTRSRSGPANCTKCSSSLIHLGPGATTKNVLAEERESKNKAFSALGPSLWLHSRRQLR